MMRTFVPKSALAIASLVAALSVSAASAASGQRVTISGSEHLVPNVSFSSSDRFDQPVVVVHQGDLVTWANTNSEPHTVSIVNRGDLPDTPEEVDNNNKNNKNTTTHNPQGFDGPLVPVLDNFQPSNANPPRLDGKG